MPGISASVVSLDPCDEEVQKPVTVSGSYNIAVSMAETNSWRFKIRLESVSDATGSTDVGIDAEIDLAPGESKNNLAITTNWNLANRLGEHTLSLTIEARELTGGGPPTAHEGAASQICSYEVVAASPAAIARASGEESKDRVGGGGVSDRSGEESKDRVGAVV